MRMRRFLSSQPKKVTFAKQDALPVLPLPTLRDSAARYLKAVQSLSDLSKEELEVEKRAAEAFETQAKTLQNELDDFAYNLTTSYISPFWTEMYLAGRWSLAVHSNPGTLSSTKAFKTSAPWPADAPPSVQVQRAAQCVKATLDFLRSIETETLEPDEFRGTPLDMQPYLMMGGSTRLPLKNRDILVRAPHARHITVLRDGEFYKVEVLDEKRIPYSAKTIAVLLERVTRAKERAGARNVAALTTLDRDRWANAYKDLKETSFEALNTIGGSLFHLALDAENPSVKTKNELVRSCLHGNGANRWFDQSFTLIVDNNGNIGSSFEHSWGDGLSMARWANFMHDKISKWKQEDFGDQTQDTRVSMVKKIDFGQVSPTVLDQIDKAMSDFEQLTKQLNLETRVFSRFGVSRMKALKASADACFQQALQLAYRRLHGKTVATYESCSTQTFLGGRTETIRSASPESHAFVMEMLDCLSAGEAERARLLRLAVNRHSELAAEAASGKGFDRHLFALQKLAESKKLPLPDMMKGKGYALLQKNILSTSTVSQEYVEQAAFGPVVANGIGVCYHFFPDRIHFCVTSYGKDAVELADKIEQALSDIERLLQIPLP